MEREENKHSGINVELIGKKKIKLTFEDGREMVLPVPRKKTKDMSKDLVGALAAVQLIVPLVFTQETTGVDQDFFRVSREEGIHDLPGGRESFYKDALDWAGGIFQKEGWEADRVTRVLEENLPVSVKASRELGMISKDTYNIKLAAIRNAIALKYPGAAASHERKINKEVEDW